MNDRIPCINPRCRRTAPAEKFKGCDEIVCGKCWKLLPKHLRDRHRGLMRRYRKLGRLIERRIAKGEPAPPHALVATERTLDANWQQIRAFIIAPERPEGLDAFLEETGL